MLDRPFKEVKRSTYVVGVPLSETYAAMLPTVLNLIFGSLFFKNGNQLDTACISLCSEAMAA
jgi:hypothetical protein